MLTIPVSLFRTTSCTLAIAVTSLAVSTNEFAFTIEVDISLANSLTLVVAVVPAALLVKISVITAVSDRSLPSFNEATN